MSISSPESGGRPAPPSRTARADFRIGSCLVRPSLNRIVTPDGSIPIEPKIMQVLVCLADSPGRAVTRERLFREVWEDAYVTQDALTRAIGELRRIFGDDPARAAVIETIRKTGYRLMVVPEAVASPGEPLASAPLASRRARWVAAIAGAAAAVLIVVLTLRLAPRPRASAPTRVRTLTALRGNTRDPAVSPDGTRVAFAWNGGEGDRFSLYVQLIDGEAPLRLTGASGVEDRVPAWSPDGQRLAFTRSSAQGCEIRIVAALGGPDRPVAPCGDREYRRLAWSPDGAWLGLARREGSSPLHIELLAPDSLARRVLTRPDPPLLGDSSPVFSPDGQTVAFARNLTDGVSDVYRVPVRGGEPTRLTFDDRDIIGIDWSPDGEDLVFSSSRAGIYSLWRVPSRGGTPVWVAGGGAKMKHPSTARSRNLIAYENWIYAVNLWRIPASAHAAGVPAARLTEAGDEWNFAPRLSPDGSRIAFISTRSGSSEIWTVDRNGGNAKRLTSFGGARPEGPAWSPDGRRLAFTVRREREAELVAMDAEGGVPERLVPASFDAVAADWSRDGRRVYFGSRARGSWQVWFVDLATRRTSPLTRDGGYAAHESPDGRWVYWSRSDRPGLWRQPISGGAPERIAVELAPEDWANWQVAPRGIYFRELRASHPQPGLALLPFGASSPLDVASLSDQGWSGFSVSADGETLVYPRVDRHACDIRVLENAL